MGLIFSCANDILSLKKILLSTDCYFMFTKETSIIFSQNKYWNEIITKTLELFEEVSFQISRYFHSFETKQAGLSLNLKLA